MLFVLIGWDAPDSKEHRPRVRPAHLAHWKDWDASEKVLLAGPMTDFAGSLFIVDAENEEAVREHASRDPYVLEGIFARTEIHPFKAVMPVRKYGA